MLTANKLLADILATWGESGPDRRLLLSAAHDRLADVDYYLWNDLYWPARNDIRYLLRLYLNPYAESPTLGDIVRCYQRILTWWRDFSSRTRWRSMRYVYHIRTNKPGDIPHKKWCSFRHHMGGFLCLTNVPDHSGHEKRRVQLGLCDCRMWCLEQDSDDIARDLGKPGSSDDQLLQESVENDGDDSLYHEPLVMLLAAWLYQKVFQAYLGGHWVGLLSGNTLTHVGRKDRSHERLRATFLTPPTTQRQMAIAGQSLVECIRRSNWDFLVPHQEAQWRGWKKSTAWTWETGILEPFPVGYGVVGWTPTFFCAVLDPDRDPPDGVRSNHPAVGMQTMLDDTESSNSELFYPRRSGIGEGGLSPILPSGLCYYELKDIGDICTRTGPYTDVRGSRSLGDHNIENDLGVIFHSKYFIRNRYHHYSGCHVFDLGSTALSSTTKPIEPEYKLQVYRVLDGIPRA